MADLDQLGCFTTEVDGVPVKVHGDPSLMDDPAGRDALAAIVGAALDKFDDEEGDR